MARSTKLVNIKEILKLYETGIPSFTGIGRVIGIDKNIVIKIVRFAKANNITYLDIKDMEDHLLYKTFYPNNTNIKHKKKEPDVDAIIKELKEYKKLTTKLLWEEYKQENPDGLGYT